MSEHKTNKPSVTVVETPNRLAKLRAALPGRRVGLVWLAGIVVIALAGSGAYALVTKQAETSRMRRAQEAAKPKRLSDEDFSMAISEALGARDRQGEIKVAQEQADDCTVNRQLILASAYANDKQYDKALAIYDQQSAKGAMSANYYSGAASVAVQAGQKDHAIAFYEQGIVQAEKEKDESPLSQANIRRFKQAIADLRKS